MRIRWVLIFSIFFFVWMITNESYVFANEKDLRSQVLAYGGKTFKGIQDPEYISYDQALRDYLVKEINKRYGITLDPKTYSGFDLLEIEAFIKCKKPTEPLDVFLKKFPKHP
jgi:hypothetical protein